MTFVRFWDFLKYESDIQKSERRAEKKFPKVDGPDGPFAHLGAESEKK